MDAIMQWVESPEKDALAQSLENNLWDAADALCVKPIISRKFSAYSPRHPTFSSALCVRILNLLQTHDLLLKRILSRQVNAG
jgi:hypothetical protein